MHYRPDAFDTVLLERIGALLGWHEDAVLRNAPPTPAPAVPAAPLAARG